LSCNKSFVKANFDTERNKGICIFDENVEVVEKIKILKDEAEKIKVIDTNETLFDKDGNCGKKKRKTLATELCR